ncbi:MAG: class I SAM-dependent methyltransferase [Candidatus Methanoperedens sp.]|nr:class I SAM-dependent methyltransferase [Candidatus Methanoperedens sp.]
MDTFEIKDDEINVEEIMRNIRDNIKKRKESGAYTKEMEALINEPLQPPAEVTDRGQDDLRQNLDYINSNCDIHAEYSINSHRPVLGRYLIWGRQLVHGEVKRYVDIIAGKQSEFNARVVRTLNNCIRGFDEKINEAVSTVNKNVESRINEAVAMVNKPGQIDTAMNYFLFEEKFRGNTEEVKQRQSIFLEYFKNCQNVLDIGCGRGEFLSLLKENGVGARGIDINEDMVSYCQKNGFDVQKVDALSYLESLDINSLDGIFTGQLVEHLQPVELINLVKMCYAKMGSESYLIVETINPLCLSVFAASFYMDLSHVKPVHPETIKFLLESVGFRDIAFKFFSPFPETARLSKLTISDGISYEEKVCLEAMNQNIDKLNSLLYGYQDYAVIAKK